MSPDDRGAAALWWSWSLASVKVETCGSQGLFKKRPEAIALHRNGGFQEKKTGGDTIMLRNVAKVWASRGTSQAMFQTGREAEFVQALKE